MEVLTRLEEFLLECLRNWGWLFPLLFSGFFLYRIASVPLPDCLRLPAGQARTAVEEFAVRPLERRDGNGHLGGG